MTNPCGYWPHCAHHCDLACNHDEWCPGYPRSAGDSSRMTRREPLRAVVRTILRALGHKLGQRIDYATKPANDLGGDDESEWLYDNRERAHMQSGCWCNSPNSSGGRR